MKCYNCGKNEADHRFLVNIMGHGAEVHLCSECLDGFKNYAAYMMQGAEQAPFLQGWNWTGKAAPEPQMAVREIGQDSFPLDAGAAIRRRRQIAELRARLQEAVGREDYEEAARLRDEILRREEEVCVYDT